MKYKTKKNTINHKVMLRLLTTIVFIMFQVTTLNASAAWLSICKKPDKPEITIKEKNYFNPDGNQFYLVVTDIKPKNCHTFEHEINETNIKWMEIINNDIALRLGDRIILQGVIENNKIKMSEIIPQNNKINTSLSFPLLLDRNILADVKFRSFGSEERASFKINHKDNDITLNCKKGEKPAGLLFKKPNTQLPLVKNQTVRLQFLASHDFSFSIADQRRFNRGNPIPLGSLTSDKREVTLPIPREKLNQKTHVHWSISCPRDQSSLKLTSLSLHSENSLRVGKRDTKEKSMWFWRPSDWQQDALNTLSILKKHGANAVFISVILDEKNKSILNKALLSNFITLAKQSNISVWAVEGDPHVVLPEARKRFTRRARIFSTYNKTHSKNQQLAGIQYDIEPYLVSGYALAPEKWAVAYVETIRTLKAAAEMPIEIVIPFWWQNQAIKGKPMLSYLSPFVTSVNVMNYRTTKDMINLFAEPLLDWGMRNQTPINIALEAGPIEDETQWRYQQQEKGELWSIKINQQSVLLLNHNAKKNPLGKSYKLQFERNISGDNVTFENKLPALIQLLPELNLYWSKWSSFNGISLHGIEE